MLVGITLLIGLVSSLFTALFVTKTIFGILIDKFGVTDLRSLPLTFPKWDRLLKPNIDWMGQEVKYFLIASLLLFMVVGGWSFFHYFGKHEILDIEFASGTSVQFQLKQPLPIGDVRQMVTSIGDSKAIPSPSVVSGISNAGRAGDVNVRSRHTQPQQRRSSKSRRRQVRQRLLNIELKSNFDGVGQKFDDVMNNSDRPDHPTTPKRSPASSRRTTWAAICGGAAIALKNLSLQKFPPPIFVNRIGRMRMQAQVRRPDKTRYRDFHRLHRRRLPPPDVPVDHRPLDAYHRSRNPLRQG